MMVSLPVGVARSAGGASPGVPTSAHFVTETWKTPAGCAGAFGIEFKKVRGATFYTFSYRTSRGVVTFPDEDTAARMVGYKGPPPPAGSGFFILAGTICNAKNPYAAMYSDPKAFAVQAKP